MCETHVLDQRCVAPRGAHEEPTCSTPRFLPSVSRLLALFAAAVALPLACAAEPFASTPDPNTTAGAGGAGGGACVPADAACTLEFTYPLGNEHSVELRGDFAPGAWEQGVPLQIDGGQWRTSIAVPNGTTVRYKFFVDGTTWVLDPKNPDSEPDGLGSQNSLRTAACDAPVCVSTGATTTTTAGGGGSGGGDPPPGQFDWRSAVMYFVFVDRFENGDVTNDGPIPGIEGPANYQGGDYEGLREKLQSGYFEDLGVNTLWLTVPFDNPSEAGQGSDGHLYSAYHGYWPKDLDAVEEHFGDLVLLKSVVDEAHARGIKVLLDYAMNHVHDSAPLFAEHPDWFWPLDYDGKYCVCGGGCDWNDSYEQKRCWFTDYLPDWNFQNPDARAYSVANAMKWIEDTGIDGYRLDAVKHIETQWIADLRAATNQLDADSGQRFYMVGETFESGNRDIIKSYVHPSLLDGQFDFPLRGVLVETLLRRSGSMYDLDGFLASNDTYYQGVMSTFIGNHDIARVIHTALDQPWGAWDNGGNANWSAPPPVPDYRAPFERMAVAFTFLMTTQGIPLIYYGDEVGMAGAGDPDNRRFMQWDGYSDHQLFLRDQIQRLGAIRKDHPALWKGTRSTVSVTQDTYGYLMSDGAEQVYVALNRGDQPGGVAGMPASGTDLLSGEAVSGPTVTLPPRSTRIILAE
jgi:glycosidase